MIVRESPPWGRAFGSIGPTLLVYTVLAAAVTAAYANGLTWLAVPALPVSLLAAALGILLGFRNNSAYDRWWEARTLWGALVNQSRTFARQTLLYLPAAVTDAQDDRRAGGIAVVRSRLAATALELPAAAPFSGGYAGDGAVRDRNGAASPVPRFMPVVPRPAAGDGAEDDTVGDTTDDDADESDYFVRVSDEARELVYAQIGFANALRCHLRRQDPFPEIAPFFRPSVVAALREEQNVPAAILVWTTTRIRRALDGRRSDDVFRLVALDGTLSELANVLGGCERIKNTPIPRQYDFLPRIMVRAYLAILPLSLVAEGGPLTPIYVAIVGGLFLALDAIGRDVETPFENDVHDTPMTALCRTIEINLRQMLGETRLPPTVQPVDGYLY